MIVFVLTVVLLKALISPKRTVEPVKHLDSTSNYTGANEMWYDSANKASIEYNDSINQSKRKSWDF